MTVSEQNTLKQIMHKKLDELGRYTRCLTDAEIYDCLKEWLQQFREQPLIRNTKTTNEYELNYTAGQLKMLRTLLEDLEK